ncbi:MAG TPA: DUF4352 domain-containing protein [Candidatus Ozemobacteraceae bacterium]|nr:DUF4352 domain-containing protein [Candidatus Ozemobacteraceae bacterium]
MRKPLFSRVKQYLIAVLVGGLLGLTACGGGESAKPGEPGKPATGVQKAETPAKPAEAPLLTVGQPGRNGAFEITLTGVEKPTKWINAPKAGRQYIVVKLKITNVSDQTKSIGAGSFGCVDDANGNRGSYERSTGIQTTPDTFGATEIKPGESFEGSIIFSIPVDMNTTELHYTVGYALKPNLRFEVKL